MEAESRPAVAPEDTRGWRGELGPLAFFLGAALLLTWPLAITLDQATGLRGDYFLNLWNAWWMRHALAGLHSPWTTDYLFYPEGLALQRHILTPVNSLVGAALRTGLGAHATFNVILLLTLTLSGWTFSLFARYLTKSRAGALLGGLLYAFNPFHFYYLCQTNIFTFEFVPLALFFFVKSYREGGVRNLVGVALTCAALAESTLHFVVYTYLVVALAVAAGKWLDARVPWRLGARRTLVSGMVGAATVGLVALPFLLGEAGAPDLSETVRANDLLGFNWIGGPEMLIASWPTMIGYSTLLLLALTVRSWRRERFWILVGAVFFLLSLGETLRVGGADTGVPLPFGWLGRIPGLYMLRSPDRCYMVVQLCLALLVAFGWRAVAERCGGAKRRVLAWGACALFPMLELTSAPLARFEHESPAWYRTLAEDPSVEAVLELPPRRDVTGGSVNFHQITHGKKEVLGLVVSYAIRARDLVHMNRVNQDYEDLVNRGSSALVEWSRASGVDLIVHHTSAPALRAADATIDGRTIWAPFFTVRRKLTGIRQLGPAEDQPLEPGILRAAALALQRDLGPPIHADSELIVFRVRR